MDSHYYPLNLNRKDGAGFGYFEYYSDNRTGNPFRTDAPAGGQGVVVNEYASPIPFTTDPFPDGTFALPALCTKNQTGVAGLRFQAAEGYVASSDFFFFQFPS